MPRLGAIWLGQPRGRGGRAVVCGQVHYHSTWMRPVGRRKRGQVHYHSYVDDTSEPEEATASAAPSR